MPCYILRSVAFQEYVFLCVYESVIFRPQHEKQNFYYLANTILCCWFKVLLRPQVSVKIFFALFIFKNVSEIII